jgi:hypothetical protein
MNRLKVICWIPMKLNRLLKSIISLMKDGIFIYGNVPSSKNSKVWTGKMLISSGRFIVTSVRRKDSSKPTGTGS